MIQSPRNQHFVKDITGQRFGRLTVLERSFSFKENKNKSARWLCRCDCGNEKVASRNLLINKQIQSCGCLNRENIKNSTKYNGFRSIPGRVWAEINYNAITRNITFDISIYDVWELYIKQNKKCRFTGADLDFGDLRRTRKPLNRGNVSLDRIDSSKGYTTGNIQLVLKDVNLMKRSMSDEDFLKFCKTVTNYCKI